MISWIDYKLPPINLWNMPDVLWFYDRAYYDALYAKYWHNGGSNVRA